MLKYIILSIYNWRKEKEKLYNIQQSFNDIKNDILAKKTLLKYKTLTSK